MTVSEILIIVVVAIFAIALLIIAIKGELNIRFTKHVVEEKKVDEIQLEIAKENLAELKKYNERVEKDAQEQNKNIISMTEAVHNLMGVDDERAE